MWDEMMFIQPYLYCFYYVYLYIKYNKNYFSRLIKSKKYNALTVKLTANIADNKQHQNTIIYTFIYTVFMFCYIYSVA